CACNSTRMWEGMNLTVSLISNTTAGQAAISGSNSTGTGGTILLPGTSNGTVAAGGNATVTIPWTYGCQQGFHGHTYEAAMATGTQAASLTVGITTTGTNFTDSTQISVNFITETTDTIDDCNGNTGGICNFRSYPGDGKIFLEETQGDSGYNGTSIVGI